MTRRGVQPRQKERYSCGSASGCGGNGGGERAGARAVALIDVGAELNDAVGRGPGGDIDPIDVDRRRQLDVEPLAGADHLVDLVAAPAGIVLKSQAT